MDVEALTAEVEISKLGGGGCSGSHNKRIGCGESGGYSPGPVEKEEGVIKSV
jgi:hypothetical protein